MADPTSDTSQRPLTDLSPHELASLTSSLLQSESALSPLVSGVLPIAELKKEYEGGAKEFVAKIDGLEKEGWTGMRRMRGDGECFYRAFAYAYVERIVLVSPGREQEELARRSISQIQALLPLLSSAGFAKDIYEDFLSPLLDLLQSFLPSSPVPPTTSLTLLQSFNDPEVTHSITYFFRLLTSAYLKANKDDFEPFLWGLEENDQRYNDQVALANGGQEGGVSLDVFCSFFVEAVNKEADHIQITALARAFGIHTRVAYLDRSIVPSFGGGGEEESTSNGKVNFIEFEEDKKGIEELGCALLYRPGHFDIIYQKRE